MMRGRIFKRLNNNQKYIMIAAAILMVAVSATYQFLSAHKVQANVNRVEELKEKSQVESQEDIAEDLIRFHVIANSDSDKDQAIKLKVRDAVLENIVPYLQKSQSLDETRGIIRDKTPEMINVAEEVLRENGVGYGAQASLGQHVFPTKYYGDFSLPAGEYEAFRIVLGNGSGANWWCVMFPPLCFVHIDEEQPEEKDSEKVKEQEDIEKAQNSSDGVEDLIEPASNIEKEHTEETEEISQGEGTKEKETEEQEQQEEQEEQEQQEQSSIKSETPQVRWRFLDILQSIFS